MNEYFSFIPAALEQLKKGNMLILVDSPNRENEGDFFIPADKATPQIINTMIRYGGGLICVAITKKQAQRLSLPLMVPVSENDEKTKVNFTVSVNARKGITTGVSAFDRVKTINILANPNSKPKDIVKPGHVFGLIAADGGILERPGHTEAAINLAKLANFNPAGVLCEIIGKNGKMATLSELIKLGKILKIKIVSLKDLIDYLTQHPLPRQETPNIVKTAASMLPTEYGKFKLAIYKSSIDNREHAVLIMGELDDEPILTRIHSECLTGDTFLSIKCDCKAQLHKSMKMIQEKGRGIIIYLNQEGRGIGLSNKIKAYSLQEKGLDTVEANHALGLPPDARDYKIAAEILRDLGVSEVILLTNNPQKITELLKHGIRIVKRVPVEISPNQFNYSYLATKKQKLNHQLSGL